MNAVDVFNPVAAKADAFDYEAEVKQVWHDFPETQDTVLFVDLCSRRLIYPGDEEKKQKNLQALRNNPKLKDWAEKYCQAGNSACWPQEDSRRIILLYTQKHSFDFLSKSASLAEETGFVFDHELGHAIVPGGAGSCNGKNFSECIADSYALIRHFQRSGVQSQSQSLDMLPENRALYFIFRENRVCHFTSPVIDQILARRYDIAWNKMMPEDTVRLARRFALAYAQHQSLLDSSDDLFSGLHGKMTDIQKGDTQPLRELAQQVLTHNHFDAVKWGIRVLKACLEKRICGNFNLDFSSAEWQELRRNIYSRDLILKSQDPLLFGISTPEKKLQLTPNIIQLRPV